MSIVVQLGEGTEGANPLMGWVMWFDTLCVCAGGIIWYLHGFLVEVSLFVV